MKNLELIGENYYISQSKIEEIGNSFYKGITGLYQGLVKGFEGIYNIAKTYGQKDGSGKGKGQKDGGRRNVNKDPCKNDKGLGYGQGRGSGKGQGRK